jgi:hypothetical protein
MAAAGLSSLAELGSSTVLHRGRGGGQSRSSVRILVVAGIAVVCAWLAFPLARRDAFLADNEARDLPAIADYLRHELRPGDAVLAAPPLEVPLAYYFYRRHLPREYVNAAPEKSGRCFVVLDARYVPGRNTAVGQIVFDAHAAARLVLLKKWNAGAVYELATAATSRRTVLSAPNGTGSVTAASQNEQEIRK